MRTGSSMSRSFPAPSRCSKPLATPLEQALVRNALTSIGRVS
jgi:hypothetical protein